LAKRRADATAERTDVVRAKPKVRISAAQLERLRKHGYFR
jgi:hypothetical protein